MRVLEVLFFSGLTGCSVVVVLSWISIFKSGFSNEDDMKMDDIPVLTQQPTAYRFMQPDLGAPQVFSNLVESSTGRSTSE